MWSAFRLRGVAVLVAVVVVYVVGVRASGTHARAFDDLAQLTVASAAFVLAWARGVASRHRYKAGWWAVATGCAGWAGGQCVWTVYELVLHRQTPFPSAADLGYLLFPVGTVAGVLLMPAGRSRLRGRDLLDGAILALTLTTVSWVIGLGAVLRDGGQSVFELTVSLAYPTSDIAVMTMALIAVSRARHYRRPLVVLAAGMGAMAVSDAVFTYQTAQGTYASGTWASTGWITAFTLISCAAVIGGASGRRAAAESPLPRSVEAAAPFLPYLPLVATVVPAGIDVASDGRIDPVAGTMLLVAVGLTMVRQYITVGDNRALVRTVAAQRSELMRQAFTDPLTGLANRAQFLLWLNEAALPSRPGQDHERPRGRRVAGGAPPDRGRSGGIDAVTVLFCDLNNFKSVNDGLGHAAGDELLTAVATRMQAALGTHGRLARLGGDEFAALLQPSPDPDAPEAMHVAHSLSASMRDAITVQSIPIQVGVSIGIASAPARTAAADPDLLLRQADIAMYTAKRSPERATVHYSPGLSLPESHDWQILPTLRRALETGSLLAHYQPIIRLRDGGRHGYEALARWPAETPTVSPAEFLPVAARAGLMRPLTTHMIRTALRQHARWVTPDHPTRVTVNVSPVDITDPLFPTLVAELIEEVPYVWGSLALEVTEEALLADLDTAIRNTRRLQQLGVVMALDDFGAGYSSLAHLAELPVDILKLDRQLIVNLDTQQGSRVIVEGLITTARRLTIDIVAEGVETRAQHDLLREMGCGYAQGFLFGGAQPAAAYGDRPWMPWTADTGPSDPGPSDPGPAGSRPARQVAETPASAG